MSFEHSLIQTPRLSQKVWTSGPQDGIPVLLIHGNITTESLQVDPGARYHGSVSMKDDGATVVPFAAPGAASAAEPAVSRAAKG